MQDPPPAEFQLDKLDLEGLQKVDREKIIEISGLKTGQRLELEDLNRATDKTLRLRNVLSESIIDTPGLVTGFM
ncbi:MAG: hypothetical protein IPG76_22270 [Acidobacteria bacterium]|nr:hypothetical protein [Acidobacteriota bacterium]